MKTIRLTSGFRWASIFVMLMLGALLQGCGGGSSTPPPANADPTGYYDTGTANVDDGTGGTLSINDLEAMVNGDHFVALSVAQDIAYEGTITSINQNDYTASVSVFKNGMKLSNSTVSGQITQGKSISGTFTGTGIGNGSFDVTYALSNDQPAALSRVQNNANELWFSLVGGATYQGLGFDIDSTGNINYQFSSDGGTFKSCQIVTGLISSIAGTSLYTVTITLSSCTDSGADGDYSGLAATRTQVISDDRLVLDVTKDNYSIYADFQPTPSG